MRREIGFTLTGILVGGALGVGGSYYRWEQHFSDQFDKRVAELGATATTVITAPPVALETTTTLETTESTLPPSSTIFYPISHIACSGAEASVTVQDQDIIVNPTTQVATHSFLLAANRVIENGAPNGFYRGIKAPPNNNADGFMTDVYNRNGLPMPSSFDDLLGVTLVVGTDCRQT